jgi:cold shock protein
MPEGAVKFFDLTRGFGFIKPDQSGGGDLFVHVDAVAARTPLLTPGMRVTFEIITDPKTGRTRAANVRPI